MQRIQNPAKEPETARGEREVEFHAPNSVVDKDLHGEC